MYWLAWVYCVCSGLIAGNLITMLIVVSRGTYRVRRKEKDMATMFDDVNAVCPFFRYSDKRRISCEGITDGCVTNLEFDCKAKRDMHRSIFCDSKYKNCEIHKMLEEKYAEE